MLAMLASEYLFGGVCRVSVRLCLLMQNWKECRSQIDVYVLNCS